MQYSEDEDYQPEYSKEESSESGSDGLDDEAAPAGRSLKRLELDDRSDSIE